MQRAANIEAQEIAGQRMQSAKDLQALTVASTVEQMLDKQIEDMGDMGDEELEMLRWRCKAVSTAL